MRVTQPVLERKRMGFLAQIAYLTPDSHLAPGGRLILVISPLEAAELAQLLCPACACKTASVSGIPGLNVVTFMFESDEMR